MSLLNPSYTIRYRAHKEGDEHGIIKLRREVTGRAMSLDEWHWKFKGQGNEKVYAFVMEEKTHGVVGHWGGIPLRMIHDGREIRGVAGCNVMIHPAFRSFVRFKKLHTLFVDELIRDSVTFIYGFPTEKTFMLPAEKLGMWERIESVHEFTKEVRFHNVPERFLYRLLPLDFNDGRINALWNDVEAEFRLSIIRDAAYLLWRYAKNPLFTYQIWGLRRRWSGTLTALIVLKRLESGNLDIVDMVFRKGMLPILLSKIENLAFRMSANRLRLIMPQTFIRSLRRSGFSSKPSDATIAKPNDPRLVKRDEAVEKFYYTMGDTDYM